VACLCSIGLYGQTPIHYQLTTEDGLPSNCVYDVYLDAEGYYWFGTDNGVARYDGARFKNFSIADGLTDNEVFVVKGDKSGRIWFLTSNGLLSFYKNGVIHNPQNTPFLREIKDNIWFSSLAEDCFHNIWISTYNGKVYRIRGNSIMKSESDRFAKILPGDHTISEISLDKDGLAWIISRGGAICLSVDPGKIISSKKIDYSLLEKGVFIPDKGICYSSNNDLIYKSFSGESKTYSSFLDSNPSHITRTENGDIWICNLKKVIRLKGGSPDPKNIEVLFPEIPIGRVRMDANKNLWLATSNRGVWLVPHLDRRHFYDFFRNDKEIQSLYLDPHNKLWLGGDKGNLAILDSGRKQMIDIPENIKKIQGRGRIKSIGSLGKDSTFIAYEECLLLAHKEKLINVGWMTTKSFLQWNSFFFIGASTNCYAIPKKQYFSISNGNLEADRQDRHLFQIMTKESGILPGKRISDIAADENGKIWIATAQGLFALHAGTWKPYPLISRYPILASPILSIKLNNQKDLLIGIQSYGLGIIRNNELRLISSTRFLENGNIRRIVIENDSMVWLCTNQGLFLMKNTNRPFVYKFQKISREHGLISKEIKDLALGKSEIYVAGDAGLSIIQRSSISETNEKSPVISFPRISVNGEVLHSTSDCQVAAGQNEVVITYGCSDLSYLNYTKFRYRLKSQQPWQTAKNFQVQLSSLASGTYRPEIQAKNPGSKWGKSVFLPNFEVLPPIWRRNWFLVLAFIATVGVSIATAQQIVRSKFEKTTLDQQLVEANLKALRAQIKPHFLFNAINAVQQFFLYNHREEGLEFLGKFSQMMRNILEGSEKQFQSIHQEMIFLKDYLEIEKERIGTGLSFELTIEEGLDSATLIPTMMIQPLVENALWHGIMKKEIPIGHVLVRMSKSNIFGSKPDSKEKSLGEFLKLVVEDNGIGRLKSARPEMESKSSFGLKSLEWKVELLQKKYKTQIDFEVIDLVDADNQASGTRVEIHLPLTWNT